MTPHQQVIAKLQAMKWDWKHPRIQAYIRDLSAKYGNRYHPENLPPRKMQRILEFLEIYDNCNKILQDTGMSWSDEMVASYFQQVSTRNKDGSLTNRLLMKGWVNFKNYLSRTYIPF